MLRRAAPPLRLFLGAGHDQAPPARLGGCWQRAGVHMSCAGVSFLNGSLVVILVEGCLFHSALALLYSTLSAASTNGNTRKPHSR